MIGRICNLDLAWLLVVFAVGGCADKAKPDFVRCEQLEKDGKLQEAASACERAHDLDPESKLGNAALGKKSDIEGKLAELVPPTVTREWCSRLVARLSARLGPEAAQKHPDMDERFVQKGVQNYVANVAYDCAEDLGKPTKGLWQCHWDEHFDAGKECH